MSEAIHSAKWRNLLSCSAQKQVPRLRSLIAALKTERLTEVLSFLKLKSPPGSQRARSGWGTRLNLIHITVELNPVSDSGLSLGSPCQPAKQHIYQA